VNDAETSDDLPLTPEEDDALFAKLERRRVEHESGPDPGIDGEEFFRQLRELRL
jgi:hypothetical protein